MQGQTRPSVGWVVGWALALVASVVSLFFLALFASAFMAPHAFGGRDGQGAAGLAALIMLVAAGGGLVSTIALLVVASKLSGRFGARWAWWAGLGLPVVAAVLGAVLARVG
jgi:hypothetical protein